MACLMQYIRCFCLYVSAKTVQRCRFRTMCYALPIRTIHHSAAPALGNTMDHTSRIRTRYQAPRSTRDRPDIDPRSTRDSPRLTEIDPTVLPGTRPRGAFCPTGFLPSAGRDRPEIDPRPARAINPTFYPPKPPLWGTPPPSPRASVSFASRQWGAGGGAKNEQGRLGRGGSILKTADRGGVFPTGFLPSA